MSDEDGALKRCGVLYRSTGFGLLECGRPEGHDGSDLHFVRAFPYGLRPDDASLGTSLIEEILGAHGWELVQ